MLRLNKVSKMSNRQAEKNMTKEISFVSLSLYYVYIPQCLEYFSF